MRLINADECEKYFYKHMTDAAMAGAINAINDMPTVDHDHVYRAGYTQAIKDIIEYMDNSDVLDYYVDPYEIGGFMLCLKNAGDNLIKEL